MASLLAVCLVTVFGDSTCSDVAAVDKDRRTALHNICACRSAISARLVECLLEAGANVGQYCTAIIHTIVSLRLQAVLLFYVIDRTVVHSKG